MIKCALIPSLVKTPEGLKLKAERELSLMERLCYRYHKEAKEEFLANDSCYQIFLYSLHYLKSYFKGNREAIDTLRSFHLLREKLI